MKYVLVFNLEDIKGTIQIVSIDRNAHLIFIENLSKKLYLKFVVNLFTS